MSLEASIVERLQELRKWQIDQQDRLLKQQQEQRELLNVEQKRMYEALGLSMEEVDVTLMDDMSLTKIQEHLDKSDVHDESSQYRSFFVGEQPAGENPTEFSREDHEKTEELNVSVEGIQPLSKRCVRIDDIPVPSPKKDFKTLLEEKLKDSDALEDNDSSKVNDQIKKRPFLRKGEGLARFRMNKTASGDKISKPRARSLPAVNVKSRSPAVRESNQRSKEKITKINKTAGISRRSCPFPKVAQQKLNLKNVGLPRSRITSRSISPLTRTVPKSAVPKSVPVGNKLITNEKRAQADESIGSDLDSSKLETKMFELLEEKAENSSFCSTSSAVVAFMQQSTPLKLKSIRKNLVGRKSKIVDDEIEALVHSLKSNKLDSKPKWDSGPFVHENPIDNNVSGTPKLTRTNVTERRYFDEQLDKNNCDDRGKLVKPVTETDTESENNYGQSVDQMNDDNASVHVRFSEFNEYKMIGLTDTSTISRDSYAEERNWTDDSSVDSSDIEILRSRDKIHQHHDPGNDNRNINVNYESTDDEQSIFNDSGSTSDDKDNTITEIKDSVDALNNWEDKHSPGFNTFDGYQSNKENELILGPELLKTSLLKLQHEIEAFRKQNLALTEQRQKLDEERREWEKKFKEKEDNLRREQMEAENNIQEEKRRMMREKAAIESRLQDAREKSIQAKQDRQEIVSLKDQLAELRDDINDKENLWQTEQARQRSQIRVLQMENSKLKQEISKLQESRQSKLRKPSVVLQTKTGQSNKPSLKKISFDDQVETGVAREKEQELERETVGGKILSSNENLIHQQSAVEDVLKKRQLYENLIKEAAGEYYDEDIENIPDNIVKSPEKPKILTPTYRKSNDFSTQTNVEQLKSTSDKNDINKRIPRLISDHLQVPHGSYQQFVREVITTKNQYSKPACESADESRQVQQEFCTDSRVPVGFSQKYIQETSRGPEVNQHVQQTIDYIMDRRINQTKFVDGNESDITPRVEKIPLPRPTDNATPHPDSIQVSHLSDLPGQDKVSLPVKQGVKEVQHPDGHIEYWYPNGNVKKIYQDGTSKMIYYNGDVRETLDDGSVKYFYAATKTWQTTYPDGFELMEFPDGQQERRTKDGTIEVSFPDGSIRLMQPDGITKWALPDGIIAETFPNGNKILSLPNGQREIHTADHKRREYPDGTVKFVYNDGTQETRYSNGRIRIKDKDGHLLFDSHHP